MEKIFITADQLLEDAFKLGLQVLESGFKPTFLIAVWRGGAPIGIAVQELLEVCGVETNHIAVRTSSYTGVGQRDKQVRVHGLHYAIDCLGNDDRVLIIDDVHDSGLSVEELIRQINVQCGEHKPAEIRLATVFYKPHKSQVARVPDYCVHETNDWLVFPHELAGLNKEELMQKPGLEQIRQRLLEAFTKR